jgi:L-lactate dehydrogenase complex protein LldF
VGIEHASSLPYASSLCGACADVCPVRIDIPRVLVHLRGAAVAQKPHTPEAVSMRIAARAFGDRRRFERLQHVALRARRIPGVASLPGPLRAWTRARELPEAPSETFRDWWRNR